ncbi:MAG TPA: TrkA family potassium uptake protein [Frankiaceae bacterium]|nr:TrkA family potassium uptake protein [Frankiaceae bacterium]
MHVVILGCGRVGSTLARSLDKRGHSVAIIDQDATAFARLGEDFGGRTVTGIGFDRDTLIEAGTQDADAFAAVSSGDNSNIIAARVARETFGVDKVVARIYDPRRAEVYERLGIPTVATVRWAATQILHRLLPEGHAPEWTDASGNVVLTQIEASPAWVGQRLSAVEEAAGVRVACLTRFGEGVLPEPRTLVQEGDLLHVTTLKEHVTQAEKVLAAGPEGER